MRGDATLKEEILRLYKTLTIREVAEALKEPYGAVRRVVVDAGVVRSPGGNDSRKVDEEKLAKIVRLRDVHRLTYAAIGQAVGMTESGAFKAYKRAKGIKRG